MSVGQQTQGKESRGGDLPAGPSSWPGSSGPALGTRGQEAGSLFLCHPSSSALAPVSVVEAPHGAAGHARGRHGNLPALNPLPAGGLSLRGGPHPSPAAPVWRVGQRVVREPRQESDEIISMRSWQTPPQQSLPFAPKRPKPQWQGTAHIPTRTATQQGTPRAHPPSLMRN